MASFKYIYDDTNNKPSFEKYEEHDMIDKSSTLTQNDLWQSHNSLRDEQHRNEDRIARQLADSHSQLQKQISDSENRLTQELLKLSTIIQHIDTQAREDSRVMNTRLDTIGANINTRIDGVNTRIDAQNSKIDGFATKKTIWVVAGIIVAALIAGVIILINFMPHINISELKELIQFAIKCYHDMYDKSPH